MKIQIWIKRTEAVSGKITEYHCHIPQVSYTNYVQVVISQDEFAKLEDNNKISIHDLNDMSMKADTGGCFDKLVVEMRGVTGGNFNEWFHKLTKNEQSKLQKLFKD